MNTDLNSTEQNYNTNSNSPSNRDSNEVPVKSKKEHIQDFIKTMAQIEYDMEPYKEARKDLRKNFIENGWLDKDEMKNVLRAWRLRKDDTDFDQLEEFFNVVKGA